jgi:hypothetical protein
MFEQKKTVAVFYFVIQSIKASALAAADAVHSEERFQRDETELPVRRPANPKL